MLPNKQEIRSKINEIVARSLKTQGLDRVAFLEEMNALPFIMLSDDHQNNHSDIEGGEPCLIKNIRQQNIGFAERIEQLCVSHDYVNGNFVAKQRDPIGSSYLALEFSQEPRRVAYIQDPEAEKAADVQEFFIFVLAVAIDVSKGLYNLFRIKPLSILDQMTTATEQNISNISQVCDKLKQEQLGSDNRHMSRITGENENQAVAEHSR